MKNPTEGSEKLRDNFTEKITELYETAIFNSTKEIDSIVLEYLRFVLECGSVSQKVSQFVCYFLYIY
jgi:hypothetical protein